ncbi:hypothetical protein R3P38DRAFT_3285587 [Favolaschia claudopus]|uniref:Uncharacterized protein n=1 Tax=Favolaschia claudopus TaxID=2862362 RepID=A0AAW0A3I6_9AGAR
MSSKVEASRWESAPYGLPADRRRRGTHCRIPVQVVKSPPPPASPSPYPHLYLSRNSSSLSPLSQPPPPPPRSAPPAPPRRDVYDEKTLPSLHDAPAALARFYHRPYPGADIGNSIVFGRARPAWECEMEMELEIEVEVEMEVGNELKVEVKIELEIEVEVKMDVNVRDGGWRWSWRSRWLYPGAGPTPRSSPILSNRSRFTSPPRPPAASASDNKNTPLAPVARLPSHPIPSTSTSTVTRSMDSALHAHPPPSPAPRLPRPIENTKHQERGTRSHTPTPASFSSLHRTTTTTSTAPKTQAATPRKTTRCRAPRTPHPWARELHPDEDDDDACARVRRYRLPYVRHIIRLFLQTAGERRAAKRAAPVNKQTDSSTHEGSRRGGMG